MQLIKEQDLNHDLEKDHFMVLMNYAQHSESQILLNEFMCTKTVSYTHLTLPTKRIV